MIIVLVLIVTKTQLCPLQSSCCSAYRELIDLSIEIPDGLINKRRVYICLIKSLNFKHKRLKILRYRRKRKILLHYLLFSI